MEPRFVTVLVEEHLAIPEGCCMRFKLAGLPRVVHRVKYESEAAPSVDEWLIEGANADDSAAPAWAVTVEDSGAGICVLVYGAEHGLRLRAHEGDSAPTVAEPYLLLAPGAVSSLVD